MRISLSVPMQPHSSGEDQTLAESFSLLRLCNLGSYSILPPSLCLLHEKLIDLSIPISLLFKIF